MRAAFLAVSALWAVAVLGFDLAACRTPYTAEDQTSNEIGTRNEAKTYELCATDDAAACTPANVRARALISFCANQRELAAHASPYDGGPPCPK